MDQIKIIIKATFLNTLTLLLITAATALYADTVSYQRPTQPTVVLIIDDLGHNLERGLEAINLPGNINYAILPHTPSGELLAKAASKANKEVLLHAPMANRLRHPLGPGALTPNLSKQEFLETLREAIESTPHIRGVNNHMGSQLTALPKQMVWLMEELARQNLYFVDSRTHANTVAADTAEDYGIPNLSRHIFLDNDKSDQAIDYQFQRLLLIAEKYGVAVGIGHPYRETINYLNQALPALEKKGIKLALASEIANARQRELGPVLAF